MLDKISGFIVWWYSFCFEFGYNLSRLGIKNSFFYALNVTREEN